MWTQKHYFSAQCVSTHKMFMNKILMKTFVVLFFMLIFSSAWVSAQSLFDKNKNLPKLEWHALSSAMFSADTADKLVLIHAFKRSDMNSARMEKEVYMHPQVVDLLNQYFYVVRLDMDADTKVTYNGKSISEKALAKILGIKSAPTTVFMNAEGTAIAAQSGMMDAKTFHKLAAYVGTGAYALTSFEEYEFKPKQK